MALTFKRLRADGVVMSVNSALREWQAALNAKHARSRNELVQLHLYIYREDRFSRDVSVALELLEDSIEQVRSASRQEADHCKKLALDALDGVRAALLFSDN